jgi:hypothetical protein
VFGSVVEESDQHLVKAYAVPGGRLPVATRFWGNSRCPKFGADALVLGLTFGRPVTAKVDVAAVYADEGLAAGFVGFVRGDGFLRAGHVALRKGFTGTLPVNQGLPAAPRDARE